MVAWAVWSALPRPAGATNTEHAAAANVTSVAKVDRWTHLGAPCLVIECRSTAYIAAR